VVRTVRERFETNPNGERPIPTDDRDLIERYVERVVIKREAIEIQLVGEGGRLEGESLENLAVIRPLSLPCPGWRQLLQRPEGFCIPRRRFRR
jgi:hypothetical protein